MRPSASSFDCLDFVETHIRSPLVLCGCTAKEAREAAFPGHAGIYTQAPTGPPILDLLKLWCLKGKWLLLFLMVGVMYICGV